VTPGTPAAQAQVAAAWQLLRDTLRISKAPNKNTVALAQLRCKFGGWGATARTFLSRTDKRFVLHRIQFYPIIYPTG